MHRKTGLSQFKLCRVLALLIVFTAHPLLHAQTPDPALHYADSLIALGQFREALVIIDSEIKNQPLHENAAAHVLAASALSLGHNQAGACLHLYKAFACGYKDYAQIQNSPRLQSLRQSPYWPFLQENFKSRFKNSASFYWGIYAGILFIIFLYNLMLFLSTKDLSFVLSALLILFAWHYEMFRNQDFGLYMFSNFLGWNYCSGMQNPVNVFISLSALSLTYYLKSLLRLKMLLPFWNKTLNMLAVLFLLFAALSAFTSLPINNIIFLFVSFCLLLYFVIGILSWSKGYRPARFFVIADIVFILCVLSILFNYFGWIDAVMQIGQFKARHIGLISFFGLITLATGDKIITLQKEKENAQEKALEVLEQKVSERTEEVVKQKQLVEEKQKEIIESISYARRLQEAILPPAEFISEQLPSSFIMYCPKDLVAGDFYWAETIGDHFLIAAADSTGHGVPGAMVSVVCSNALNRAVKEFRINDPGKILDKTRALVIETFEKGYSEVKDGMDISLLCINKADQKVYWSGANNPLWYWHNNEMKEIKANKQAIGKGYSDAPFTSHEIQYTSGDWFYLFTDGMADQFGGPKGKKYKYKALMDVLRRHAMLSAEEQRNALLEDFRNWKGNLEQVDDVCIIGLSLP